MLDLISCTHSRFPRTLTPCPPSAATMEPEKQQRQLPLLTVKNVLRDVYDGVLALFIDPAAIRFAGLLSVFLSSIACKLIIRHVSYTEIDFSTYMQQIEMVNDKALDYAIIGGDTGPIVYPAGFVQVYQALHWLTDGGQNLGIAQLAFSHLFSFTVLLTAIAYAASSCPPWTVYLLLGSKRLYSIYVLRLFNDCFATVGIVAMVMLLQLVANLSAAMSASTKFLLCAAAADLYSLALSVKMNVLLFLPAFVFVVYFLLDEQLHKLLAVLLVIPLIQVLVGWHFLLPLFWDDETCRLRRNYLTNAFDFSRQFLYKWTVNWRFVPEEVFLSSRFATLLLMGHVTVLLFFLVTRFASRRVIGKSFAALLKDAVALPLAKTIAPQNMIARPGSGPRLILLIFAVTNLIGVLFARSLHYQFLAWYCWLLPFLLHAAGCNVFVGVPLFLAHEWCWNVYPSTNTSSMLLVVLLSVILLGVWNNKQIWSTDKAEPLNQVKTGTQ